MVPLRRRSVFGIFGFYLTWMPPTFLWCPMALCCLWTMFGMYLKILTCICKHLCIFCYCFYIVALPSYIIWPCNITFHPGSSSSAATSQVKLAWHPTVGWTAWLAIFPQCSALWRSRILCFSFTLMRCHRMIPMRSVCSCHYSQQEFNRILYCMYSYGVVCHLHVSVFEMCVFQLQGLEVPLVAVLQWSTHKMPFTNCIYTHYRWDKVKVNWKLSIIGLFFDVSISSGYPASVWIAHGLSWPPAVRVLSGWRNNLRSNMFFSITCRTS